MLYCDNCKITIRTEHKCCPLCHGGLSGAASIDDSIFPDIPAPKKRQISFFSMLTFCCVLAFIFSYLVNNIIPIASKWFIYVIGGICLVWIVLVWGKSKRKNLLKNTIGQMIIIGVGVGICDVFIGWKGWAVDYAWPILIFLSLIINVFITWLKKLQGSDYMIYLLMNCIFGLIPLLLLQLNIVKFIFPSIICSGFAMVLLAVLVIFRWDQVRQELVKKFHM